MICNSNTENWDIKNNVYIISYNTHRWLDRVSPRTKKKRGEEGSSQIDRHHLEIEIRCSAVTGIAWKHCSSNTHDSNPPSNL
jgi:hypothetical protein